MPRRSVLLLFAVSTTALAACGTTLRAGIGPTIDTDGNPGVLARVEAGITGGFTSRVAGAETAGFSGGVGRGYGDGDSNAAFGLVTGLDFYRQGEHSYDLRFGPTFRVELPSAGDPDKDVTVAIGVRVALLRVLSGYSTTKTWRIEGGEKGGASFDFSWDHVRHLSIEASADFFWNDARGERLRFGALIGYEASILPTP